MSPSTVLVAKLIQFLQHWVRRGDRRSINISTAAGDIISISGGKAWSQDEFERIIDTIIRLGRDK